MQKQLRGSMMGESSALQSFSLEDLWGVSFAFSNPEKAILADFSRLKSILEREGKEKLAKVLEEEILEEVYSELERLKDVQ